MVRNAADGSGARGATEPLAAVGKLIPKGVTNGSGGGPSHGASTRTSCPMRRNSRAKPITCACTPPGMETLYGLTIATRSMFTLYTVDGEGVSPRHEFKLVTGNFNCCHPNKAERHFATSPRGRVARLCWPCVPKPWRNARFMHLARPRHEHHQVLDFDSTRVLQPPR